MSNLLDGATVPWDFTNPAIKADATVVEAVRRRRADAAARAAAQMAERTDDLRRGTQAIATAGLSARELGRQLATNLRRPTPTGDPQ